MVGSQDALTRRLELHEWFGTPPGMLVAGAYRERLETVLPDLFGYHLVQVGRLGQVDLIAPSRILNRAVIDTDGAGRDIQVRASATALPVESDSVDVVLLPHVLEFERDPHAALREAFRVLVPEGYLLVFGFNPWSLLGLWRLALRRRGKAPWHGSFLPVSRLEDWLALLGIEVLSTNRGFFRPPLKNARLLRRLEFLETAGRRAIPYLCGTYLLVARKRRITLTPLRPRWRPSRRLVGVGLAEPSARSAHDE